MVKADLPTIEIMKVQWGHPKSAILVKKVISIVKDILNGSEKT